MDDESQSIVKREVHNDHDVLPLWNGRVIATVVSGNAAADVAE
jgi:hypothetical protein